MRPNPLSTELDLRAVVLPTWTEADLAWAIAVLRDEFRITHQLTLEVNQ